MTRKDYVKFAQLLQYAEGRSKQQIVSKEDLMQWLRIEIADIFAADSPRFDRERFRKACEAEQEA